VMLRMLPARKVGVSELICVKVRWGSSLRTRWCTMLCERPWGQYSVAANNATHSKSVHDQRKALSAMATHGMTSSHPACLRSSLEGGRAFGGVMEQCWLGSIARSSSNFATTIVGAKLDEDELVCLCSCSTFATEKREESLVVT